MSNSYGPNDPRRFIREKTSGIVDVGKDIGKDLLDKVRPEVKDTVVKGAQFAGNVFQDAKTITKEEKYDPSAYVTAGAAYGLEYFGKGVEFLTNQIAQKTGIDPTLVALGEMFVPYSKIGKLAKLSKVSKVKNVQKLNNISDLSFLNKVENITGQTNLQTQAAQFINTGDDLSGMFKPNSLSYKKTFREFNEGIPTGQAKKDAVIRHLQAIDEGRPIPYFRDTKTGKIKYLDNKGVDAKTGEISYMMRDVTLKRKDSSMRRAAEKAKTIPLQDYIDELGEVLGKKGYDLDQKRFERLYRWVGKNVHVDHMNPLMGEGFHHPSNLILLKATDNLKKGKKLLPDEFFAEMEIPLTKRDLIRSSIQNPKYSNKVKRQKILETLNIVNK